MHSSRTIGLDGCRGGWAVAALQNGEISFSVISGLDELDLSGVARIFIDIPVGLPETGQRVCDLKLREILPSHLKSSVFPCPVRDAVFAPDYTAARRISIDKTGKSMSIQAWNICPKIRRKRRWFLNRTPNGTGCKSTGYLFRPNTRPRECTCVRCCWGNEISWFHPG